MKIVGGESLWKVRLGKGVFRGMLGPDKERASRNRQCCQATDEETTGGNEKAGEPFTQI